MGYGRLAAVLPRAIVEEFSRQLYYNHVRIEPRRFTGFIFLYSFLLSIAIAANAYLFLSINPLIVFSVLFAGIVFTAYSALRLNSEANGKEVEKILPDALQLIASNMKSGLTTERALFVAGRPEFGSLEVELKNASKRISSGENIEVALNGISTGINSPVLGKTIWLVSRGIRSGGQIADLLFQLADDLKNQQALEEETSSNISIYILLIVFASAFGAPLLFGVSSFIVEILAEQTAQMPDIDIAAAPISGPAAQITSIALGDRQTIAPGFIINFSIITLFFTIIFSSLTIGVIGSGRELNGIKFVVPLMIISFLVFFSIRELLKTVISGIV